MPCLYRVTCCVFNFTALHLHYLVGLSKLPSLSQLPPELLALGSQFCFLLETPYFLLHSTLYYKRHTTKALAFCRSTTSWSLCFLPRAFLPGSGLKSAKQSFSKSLVCKFQKVDQWVNLCVHAQVLSLPQLMLEGIKEWALSRKYPNRPWLNNAMGLRAIMIEMVFHMLMTEAVMLGHFLALVGAFRAAISCLPCMSLLLEATREQREIRIGNPWRH